jgi:hypothetical protein
MVFSRKPRNSLFFVMLRSLLSCSPTLTNSMSTLAPPQRTCTLYVSLKVFLLFFFLSLSVFVDAATWNLNNGTVRVGFIIMTRTKKIYDQYQKALGIDLWSAQYEVNISFCLSSNVWSIFKAFVCEVCRKCKSNCGSWKISIISWKKKSGNFEKERTLMIHTCTFVRTYVCLYMVVVVVVVVVYFFLIRGIFVKWSC